MVSVSQVLGLKVYTTKCGLFVFYVCVLPACMYVHTVYAWYLVPREARIECQSSLELEVQMVVSHHVGAGN